MKKMSPFIAIFSSLLGSAAHYYLMQEHFVTKYSRLEGSQLCNISSYLNCGKAIASSYSEFFGIPLAIFGLILNIVILFYVGSHLLATDKTKHATACNAFYLSAFSVAASVVMAIISFTIIKSLCPFCLAAYIFSFITLAACWCMLPGSLLINRRIVKSLAMALSVFAALSFVFNMVLANKYHIKDIQEMVDLRVATWKGKTPIDVTTTSPITAGPADAKMKIVEFADFLCIHCKLSYPKLHLFLKAHKDVQLQFQAFPLDGCAGETPGKRCFLAMLSHCGNEQNKGWDVQKHLFGNQQANYNLSVDAIQEAVTKDLSLDASQMQACLDKPETLQTIKDQLALGKKLGIKGTPGFFINKKPFPGAGDLSTLEAVYKLL